jgi:PAS domain S-box-containing protein
LLGETARLLVAGGTEAHRERICGVLRRRGYEVVSSPDLSVLQTHDPQIPDLIFVTGDVVPMVAAARQMLGLASVPLVALVSSPDDLLTATAAGGDDVCLDGLPDDVLDFRIRRVMAAAADRESAVRARRSEEALLEIQRLATSGGELSEVLREILLQAAVVMEFDRASIVLTAPTSEHAYVVAATDDPTMSKFPVDLAIYPELRTAMHKGDVVLIGDAPVDPLFGERGEVLAQHNVRSIAVFPIEWRGRPCGTVFYRAERPNAHRIGQRRLAFGRIVAGVVGQLVGGGQVLELLRDQTQRISLQRYETERRLRAIEQLAGYFDAGSDGVVVLDGDCKVLFVNDAAESITGWARDGLVGHPLTDLIPDGQREGFAELVARIVAGTNLEAFDLDITTTSGEAICVSVATSTMLSEHGAAILSFRDVTAERALETELRKTKEFLEKLIDSTVDAIVAADVEGQIILFNPGAERLFGLRADETIGLIPVEKLYPEGVARQIMRMLRSPSYGGVGRLEVTRREIVTKEGELVPVNMTASVIYEDGIEVATVGILSDLRDRIRIEQRLLQAQEKLLITEKQAVVAELAGAAAHELNQPLTSVLLSIELLQKKLKADDPHWRMISTIYREASRMAEIVKKIGKITRYETKAYVGSQAILDLEKSSEVSLPTPADTEGAGGTRR